MIRETKYLLFPGLESHGEEMFTVHYDLKKREGWVGGKPLDTGG